MITLTAICIAIAWTKLSLFIIIWLRIFIGRLNFMPIRFIAIWLLPITLLAMAMGTAQIVSEERLFYDEAKEFLNPYRKHYIKVFNDCFTELLIENW